MRATAAAGWIAIVYAKVFLIAGSGAVGLAVLMGVVPPWPGAVASAAVIAAVGSALVVLAMPFVRAGLRARVPA